jgi:phage protein D
MYPQVIVNVNGRPIASSGGFVDNLISITINDQKGVQSDTIDLTFNASSTLKIPRKKDTIEAWMGYREEGVVYFGKFEINSAQLQCYPHIITVKGKASDFKSDLKTNRSRHFDDKTLGDIFSQLAQENGLEPVISGNIASVKYDYLNMEDESILHFGHRMSQRENGLFDIKDGKLLLLDADSPLSASGQTMTPLVITPQMHVPGSCSINFDGRAAFKDVEAQHHDKKKAKREILKAPADPEGQGTLRLPHAFGTPDEAQRAAASTAKQLQRDSITTSIDIEGNPQARGGVPFIYAGFHPEADAISFMIDTAGHRFSKDQSYTTSISGKVQVQ